jgi:hypothetical protein
MSPDSEAQLSSKKKGGRHVIVEFSEESAGAGGHGAGSKEEKDG